MSTRTDRLDWRERSAQLRNQAAEHRLAYLLLAPSFLSIVLILWLPFINGVRISFYDWPLGGEATYIGLENYAALLDDRRFITSLKATGWYMTTTVFQLVLGLGAALAVNQMRRFQNITSASFLVAFTLPPVIIGGLWKYLLDPRYGPFFGYLREFGIIEETIFWSTQGDIALAAITGVMSWTIWPFMFLVLFASRQGIPNSYYEAAKVYGAGPVARFWRITIPQLKSSILVVVALRVIWNLSEVSQPLTLTGGGPGYDTSILGIFLYRLLIEANLGLASTSGVILFLISLVGVVLFFRSYDKEVNI